MIQAFSFDIFSISFLGRFIRSEIHMLFVYYYIRLPIFVISGHAHKTRKISFLWPPPILRISRRGRWAQISYAVIIAYPVYMIHRAVRQISMYVKPSHSVRLALFTLKEKSYVSVMMATAGYVANFSPLRHTFFPCKNACGGRIVQRVVQFFLGHMKSPGRTMIRGIAW